MSFAASNEHILAIASYIESVVRPEVIQAQAEDVVGCLDWQFFPQLLLRHLQSAFSFTLYFNETACFCVE
jgi:hypothetical protein